MAKRKLKAKRQVLTEEELLAQALVPEDEQPYPIPENWVWVRLVNGFSECFDTFREPINADARASREGDIPYYGATGQVGWIDDYLTDEHLVLIGEDGAPFFDYIKDKAYIIDGKAWVNNHAHILRSFFGITGNLFMMHYLNIFNYRGYVNGTTRLKLTQGSMNMIPIPLPPLSEQLRIAECIESMFEKLDHAKELAQTALDSFETRKAAILHKAFTGELTAKWRNKKGVGMVSWEKKPLYATDIEIIDGDRGSYYPKNEEFTQLGYCLFLNAKNVTKNGFVFTEMQFISKEKDKQLRKGRLQREDVVLTTRGTVGNIAYYDNNIPFDYMRINSGMVIFRGGNDFSKPYLCWLFKSKIILDQISLIKTGSAQPQLPIKIMKNLLLPLPSLSEQQEIVRILDSLFEKEQHIRELCDVIEKIDMMKKAILARAFRGILGTNKPSEESAVGLLREGLVG
ncbi:MAG: restriction endonuclease subunit S [Treponema sp.]|jgi:type I restriction enzyme S subunit|nr:restriction endonuclease subunit S [Treponema sp.]